MWRLSIHSLKRINELPAQKHTSACEVTARVWIHSPCVDDKTRSGTGSPHPQTHTRQIHTDILEVEKEEINLQCFSVLSCRPCVCVCVCVCVGDRTTLMLTGTRCERRLPWWCVIHGRTAHVIQPGAAPSLSPSFPRSSGGKLAAQQPEWMNAHLSWSGNSA